jgi:hypothetical protein
MQRVTRFLLAGACGFLASCSTLYRPPARESSADPHTVLLLHLNEGQGAATADSSPQRQRVQPLDPATISWTEGRFGAGLRFAPSGAGTPTARGAALVVDGAAPSLNPTKEITIEFWARARDWKAQGSQMLISKSSQYDIHTHPTGLYVRLYQKGTEKTKRQYQVGHRLANNTWHHFALVYDGRALVFYIDGQPARFAEESGELAGPAAGNPHLYIGAAAGNAYPFDGDIDEVRISDIARPEFRGISRSASIEAYVPPPLPANAEILSAVTGFTPAEAISKTPAEGTWQQLETPDGSVLYGFGPGLPQLTFPLQRQGWYDIYIGLYSPGRNTDGEDCSGIHVKLTADTWYTQIDGGRGGLGAAPEQGCVDNIFWKRANLTGQNLLLYQPYGKFFRPAGGIRHIALVRLTDEQAQADRLRREATAQASANKEVCGMADFWSWVFGRGSDIATTEATIRNHHEAGIDTVFFMINAGGYVQYHSRVGEWYSYAAAGDPRPQAKSCEDILFTHDPLRAATAYAHLHGVKILPWFRITNDGLSSYSQKTDYSERFGQYALVGADGASVGFPSLGYKPVRDYKLSLLRELLENYDVDGVFIDFQRDLPVIGIDAPVADEYTRRYGADPRVDARERANMRWRRFRAEIITDFMREIRRAADAKARHAGRPIQVGARVSSRDNLWKGLDVETWIREGILDIVVPSERVWFDPIVDVAPFVEMARGTRCRVIAGINPFFAGGTDDAAHHPNKDEADVAEIIATRCRQGASPVEYARRVLDYYEAGADGVSFYESEGLTARGLLVPMFRACRRPADLVQYLRDPAAYTDAYRREVASRAGAPPPAARITLSLAEGAIVSGPVEIVATVEGFSPDEVVFAINDKVVSTEGAAPYQCFGDNTPWDTTRVSNGQYTIRATASSTWETVQTISTQVTVRVNNAAPAGAPPQAP